MSTTTFTRYIPTADYANYALVYGSAPSTQTLEWMKSWTKAQRLYIFRHFAIEEDGRLMKLQGLDIRPYLVDIANTIGEIKGVHPVTGYSMRPEPTDIQLELALC